MLFKHYESVNQRNAHSGYSDTAFKQTLRTFCEVVMSQLGMSWGRDVVGRCRLRPVGADQSEQNWAILDDGVGRGGGRNCGASGMASTLKIKVFLKHQCIFFFWHSCLCLCSRCFIVFFFFCLFMINTTIIHYCGATYTSTPTLIYLW